eukprot:TRINITY_DN10291_c0_g3_i2.p1 TRINITY_DN10291_c0_g3~~TRINITY_DN10291_c0_g3_i2.p1  ORF type:complete len:535 (+),score=69.92 TRINITY_DN10291_c0_g3_i2:113-1717(+)
MVLIYKFLPICALALQSSAASPNFVFIVIDDAGFNDVPYNNPEIIAPTVKGLAQDGIILDRAYLYMFCAPSRASMLSGRFPWHTVQNFPDNAAGYHSGLQLSYTLLPALLGRGGYRSYHYGKHHQGSYHKAYIPAGRGFDRTLGYLCMNKEDHWADPGISPWFPNCSAIDWWDTFTPPKTNQSGMHVADRIAQAAVEDIESHPDGVPLYMHVAFYNIHEPIQEMQEYIDLYPHVENECRKITMAMSSHVDAAVTNITQALIKRGLMNNTIVVVTTDNGGELSGGGGEPGRPGLTSCGNNCVESPGSAPKMCLRGGKHSLFEGGVRGATFVTSPLLPAEKRGTHYSGLIHTADWYATFAALAGLNTTNTGPVPPDGVNIWPALTGQTDEEPHTDLLIMAGSQTRENISTNGAFIARNETSGNLYKLIIGRQWPNWWQHLPDNRMENSTEYCDPYCIYDITTDPEERVNLRHTQPELYQPLYDLYAQRASTFVPGDEPCQDCTAEAYCSAAARYGGYTGPYGSLPDSLKQFWAEGN